MSRPPAWPFVVGGLLAATLLITMAESYRAHKSLQRPLVPVAFEHADHRETACADCHHNFVDDTGGGTCYNCHKYEQEIAADMEKMFHDFCFSCHVSKRQEGKESGPMRSCGGCHPG